jgi:hypothetical protein
MLIVKLKNTILPIEEGYYRGWYIDHSWKKTTWPRMAFCPIKLNDDCEDLLVYGAVYKFSERCALIRYKDKYLIVFHDDDGSVRIHQDLYGYPIVTVPPDINIADFDNFLNGCLYHVKRAGFDEKAFLYFGLDIENYEPYCS